jgi:hypothetical protein
MAVVVTTVSDISLSTYVHTHKLIWEIYECTSIYTYDKITHTNVYISIHIIRLHIRMYTYLYRLWHTAG